MKYRASERAWVMRLLARLTPAERDEYEKRMRAAPGYHSNGKKYDSLKAQVAEQVMLEFRQVAPLPPAPILPLVCRTR